MVSFLDWVMHIALCDAHAPMNYRKGRRNSECRCSDNKIDIFTNFNY